MLERDANHIYRWQGHRVAGVTDTIRHSLGDPFEKVAPGVLERARQRGVAVHRACELDDEGRLDESTVDARIWPYIDAWREFRHRFRFRVIFAEKMLYSEVYGFAGQPDLAIGVIPAQEPTTTAWGDAGPVDDPPVFESVAVIDRKTGLPGVAAAMQTAAYAKLIESRMAVPMPIRRFALRMMPNGKFRLSEYDAPGDWREFLACLVVERLRERIAHE